MICNPTESFNILTKVRFTNTTSDKTNKHAWFPLVFCSTSETVWSLQARSDSRYITSDKTAWSTSFAASLFECAVDKINHFQIIFICSLSSPWVYKLALNASLTLASTEARKQWTPRSNEFLQDLPRASLTGLIRRVALKRKRLASFADSR